MVEPSLNAPTDIQPHATAQRPWRLVASGTAGLSEVPAHINTTAAARTATTVLAEGGSGSGPMTRTGWSLHPVGAWAGFWMPERRVDGGATGRSRLIGRCTRGLGEGDARGPSTPAPRLWRGPCSPTCSAGRRWRSKR